MIEHGEKPIAYSYVGNFREVKQKDARPQNGNFAYTITFDKALDPALLFLRTRDEKSFSLSKANGLTMKLKPETISELGNPSFIGKRQQHLTCTAETALDFSAKSADEKAGMVIFQDEKHFYFLAKSTKQGKPVVQLFKSTNDKNLELLAQTPVSADTKKVMLRIDAKGDAYAFYVAEKPNDWKLLKDKVDGKFLSTQVAGGFIGCVFGLYATSSGSASDNAASFNYLRYSGTDSMYK